MSPATTVARTPDTPSCSAARYAVAGASSVTTISMTGSAVRMQRPRHDRSDDRPDRETAGPDDDEGNDGAGDIRSGAAQREGHRAGGGRPGDTARRYTIRADASLMRLSPSRIVTMRRGTPRRRKIAVAATASGGATIAPRVTAAATGIAVSCWTTRADGERS